MKLRHPWPDIRAHFSTEVRAGFSRWIGADQPHFGAQFDFALSRLDDGIRLLEYCELHDPGLRRQGQVDTLDIGAGNGGVALAFANCERYRVHLLDIVPNPVARAVPTSAGIPLQHVLASGTALPFGPESFDLVLLVDAIEHIPQPGQLGLEILRVLRPAGLCIITTAARIRHILGKDPHYGIPGLVALPNPLQRFVVNRIARRRIGGLDGRQWPAYDVEHLYWHVGEIARLFPGALPATALYGITLDPTAPFFTREWWRWRLRGFLFDHVLIRKPPLAGTTITQAPSQGA